MNTKSFDAERYKRRLHEGWNDAAPGWEAWASVFDRAGQPVSERLIALAEVKPGDRVVDIATGTGEPALTAARVVGPSGCVIGIDVAPAMLAAARRRAAALGLDNLEFRHGDAESLALEEGGFDTVLCRWGLMFVVDLDSTIRGIFRLLKKGGRFATAVWAEPHKVPILNLAKEAARKFVELLPRVPGMPDEFRLADTCVLEGALERAGFHDTVVERLAVCCELDSPQAFFDWQRDISYPFRTLIAKQPPEVQGKIAEAVIESARRYAAPDGRVRLTNEAILFAAHS